MLCKHTFNITLADVAKFIQNRIRQIVKSRTVLSDNTRVQNSNNHFIVKHMIDGVLRLLMSRYQSSSFIRKILDT